MRRERAFTIIEVLITAVVIVVVLSTVVLLARQFLYQLLWSGETFAGVHEAALIEGTLRRDLARTALVNGALAVELAPGALSITLPPGSRPGKILYKLDDAAHALVRSEDGGISLALAGGLVRAFSVQPRWIVTRAGAALGVEALAPGDRVQRAGLLIELTVKGQPVAGNPDAAQGVALSTHVFPHFANLTLAGIWRKSGGNP